MDTPNRTTEARANEAAIQRESRARDIVRKHMLVATGSSLVPVPVLDAAVVTGVQVRMLMLIAELYGFKFESTQRTYSIVGSLLGGLGLPFLTAPLLGSVLKLVPGIGTVASFTSFAIVAGASTYAVGRVFIQHFESGGSLLSFNPALMREHMRAFYAEGLKVASTDAAEETIPDRP